MLYDMDACHGPTGVTRHALAQLERLAGRPDMALSLITGRMTHPDGWRFGNRSEAPSRELPLRTRDILRWWRCKPWPPIEWWAGPLDWVYRRLSSWWRLATPGGRSPATTFSTLAF